MTVEKRYDLNRKRFFRLEKKIENLDRKNDPEADTLRIELDKLQSSLYHLSELLESKNIFNYNKK